MFERLDRIHYDFLKNLMIFTKIHVFACLNWGEKQPSQLNNFGISKPGIFSFGPTIWGYYFDRIPTSKIDFGQFQRLEMCKLVISITFERLEIDFLCENLSF